MLYLIASLLKVSPLWIIIVVVPPADGLFVFSGRGISSCTLLKKIGCYLATKKPLG